MVFLSLAWFLFTIFSCLFWYQKDGLLFILDLNRVAIFIWGFGTGLYDLGLSDLYHPTISINVVAALIVGVFFFFEMTNQSDSPLLKDCFAELRIPNNVIYWFFFAVVAGVAFLAFKTNADAGQLRGLSDNPGMQVNFEGGYLYRLTVPVAICLYVIGRYSTIRPLKFFAMLFFVFFVYLTACDLSRGPIVWILTGCLLFELLWYVKRTGRTRISGKTLILVIAVLFATVFSFDYFGAIRTSTLFSSVSAQYQMNVDIPDGFTWVYIYISSPLENARYALENITVATPSLGARLFYPFIKFASNLVGIDDSFTAWLSFGKSVYAYMATDPGLTVGSFILDAYQDFSFLGIVIYPTFYGLVSVLVKRMLAWQRLSSLTKLIVYALLIQGPLWSIFDNTVFSGPLWVCAFVMVAIDLATSFLTDKKRATPTERSGDRLYLAGRR